MQPGPKTNQAVGAGNQLIGGWRAQRTEDVHAAGMALEEAFCLQRCRKRRFQTFGQTDNLLASIGLS